MSKSFEALEQRSLMSASVVGNGLLLVSTTSGDDQVTIRISPTDPQVVQYREASDPTQNRDFQLSSIHSVSINTWQGDDQVFIGAGLPGGVISLGSGADRFTSVGNASEVIYAGADGFHDTGVDKSDLVFAGGGNDIIYGGDGNDALYGGAGNDRIYGEAGRDSLFGEANNDVLYGGKDNDQLDGGANNDVLYGGANDDVLTGGAGTDRMYGEAGNDTIFARDGNGGEIVDGGTGSDRAQIDLFADQVISIEQLLL